MTFDYSQRCPKAILPPIPHSLASVPWVHFLFSTFISVQVLDLSSRLLLSLISCVPLHAQVSHPTQVLIGPFLLISSKSQDRKFMLQTRKLFGLVPSLYRPFPPQLIFENHPRPGAIVPSQRGASQTHHLLRLFSCSVWIGLIY